MKRYKLCMVVIGIHCYILSGCANRTLTQAPQEYNEIYTMPPRDTIRQRPIRVAQQPSTSSPDLSQGINFSERENEIVITSFTTKFNTFNRPRAKNIRIATNKLDGVMVAPNEVFSFNAAVGKTGPNEGYQKATIFIKGEKSKGFGGGVCQVSTTLYNAVQKAEFEIVERHVHSRDVEYVEEGEDAAIAYGSLDFKFKNNRAYPVKISSKAVNGRVSIEIAEVRIK